jgi:superfamily II DNA or RNA helicase
MALEVNYKLTSRNIEPLLVHVENSFSKGKISSTIHPYLIGHDMSRIPFSYGRNIGTPIPANYSSIDIKYIGTLRLEQRSIIIRAFQILKTKNCLLLSTHVGFGKTILALYILSELRLKTVIVVNRIVLIQQWKDSIEKVLSGARICILDSKNAAVNTDNYDIFIINLVNVCKITSDVFNIGVVIIDEVHTTLSEKMCSDLLYFTPKYLIGLSATPYRLDGTQKLFDLFFGNDATIFKPLLRAHVVYKINTDIKIKLVKVASTGRVNWDATIKQQADNSIRNQLIVNIVKSFSSKTFLILCKRVSHIDALEKLFFAAEILTEAIHGSKTPSSFNKRVLIGTVQKLGTGFDCPGINALLLACDIERYFIQALGRVFRDPRIEPVIFDLVDENEILRRHYSMRRQVYIEAGGTIIEKARTFFDCLPPVDEQ